MPKTPTSSSVAVLRTASRGDADLAIDDFDRAIKLAPDHVGALYSRGLTYSNKGQWERAIKDYDQAIKLSPNNVMAITNRGNAYLALKQYDRAIARLRPGDQA